MKKTKLDRTEGDWERAMITSPLSTRCAWIISRKEEILRSASNNHKNCQSDCSDGYSCHNQSDGTFQKWAFALEVLGIECDKKHYVGVPIRGVRGRISINRGIAEYISKKAPKPLLSYPR